MTEFKHITITTLGVEANAGKHISGCILEAMKASLEYECDVLVTHNDNKWIVVHQELLCVPKPIQD